ncbi:MAG TPA: polysaccharide deacetylase family protein [Actinopolymorphaceae bacterium]
MSGSEFTFAGSRKVLLTLVGVGAAALFVAFGAATAQGIPILAVAPPVSGPVQPGAQGAGPQELDLPMPPDVRSTWEDLRSEMVSAPWEDDQERPEKVVYLTFDDGPSPVSTPQILELLEQYDARATFFMLGPLRRAHPELVGRIEAAGHRVGNHSETHSSMTSLPDAKVREEIRLGGESRCFRPPYGAVDERVEKIVDEFDMRVVKWTVDPGDWNVGTKADAIAKHVLTMTTSESIILLHDGGGRSRANTVQALATILADLSAEGYVFHALPC